jgi:hypothetical protein
MQNYSVYIDPVDVKGILSELRDKYRGQSKTFEQFAKPILGEYIYNNFLLSSGYTDYVQAGTEETLYDYGMEDNASFFRGFAVDWHNLVRKMATNIGEKNFRFSQNVTKITKSPLSQIFLLTTEDGNTMYKCRKVIVATTITSLRKLFPQHPIYKEIKGQPFMRVYGKFSKKSIPILKEYIGEHITVKGHLQKIIAINPDTGVYMIVYNDNHHTLALKHRTENNEKNRDYYCYLLKKSIGIPKNKTIHLIAIRSFYWKTGTHYFKPLHVAKFKNRNEFIDEAQHPEEDILVVGEVVSKHQGWVEGALESVDLVVTKNWIKSTVDDK